MITYNWTFPQFEVVPVEGTMENVVKIIHWRLIGSDGTFSSEVYGSITLPNPDPTDFVPFDEITKEWTVNEVSKYVDVPHMEAIIAAQIEQQKNPPAIPVPPPFPE